MHGHPYVFICLCVHLHTCAYLLINAFSISSFEFQIAFFLYIFRPDMSPTWHSHISDLTCWHAESKRVAMEQSKANAEQKERKKGRESEREAGLSCVFAVLSTPKFRRGQTRTLAALRLASFVGFFFLGGGVQQSWERTELQPCKMNPISKIRHFLPFSCDDAQANSLFGACFFRPS